MPWKQVKDSAFRSPTRQELSVIAAFLVICLIVIGVFALRT